MTMANQAHDLNAYSKGRFTLGLGSQIRAHITKRFSMPWGAPAAQMRELVLAMRAIWANWYDGEPLRFEGKYYQHTLMTPAFTPEDTAYGAPKVVLAAVGPIMTEVAAEVGDGLIIHPFSNEKYIREVTLPAVERGWQRLASSARILKSATPLSLCLVRMNKPLMLKKRLRKRGSRFTARRLPTNRCLVCMVGAIFRSS